MRAAVAKLGWSVRRFWLALRVHIDAVLCHPIAYCTAAMWLLLGLRVRGRSQLEPLLGQSPKAYRLWQWYQEQLESPDQTGTADLNERFVIGIDARFCDEGLEETIANLRQLGGTIEPVIIDSPDFAALEGQKLPFWLCVIRPGDELAVSWLSTYSIATRDCRVEVVYADDDLIDSRKERHSPHFKPDWNTELFRWHDYVSYSCLIKIKTAEEIKVTVSDPSWPRNLVAQKVRQNADCVAHVPAILHHRRQRSEPSVPQKQRIEVNHPDPSITVIVPTRNRVDLLRSCLSGLASTHYRNRQTIIVDNDSDDPLTKAYLRDIRSDECTVLPFSGPFNFAAMNNFAVEKTDTDYICFLNNDIEMLCPDWLRLLVDKATRPDVGAVGPCLVYGDGTIQHAGVVLGVGGGAAHAHRGIKLDDPGFFLRHRLPQFVSAVTGACLVVKRERFWSVGGFDPQRFAVAFNDVDLCLRLNASGWQSFYEPRAILVHHESKSRGKDHTPAKRARFAGELAALKERWNTEDFVDPFHNPALSRYSETFVVRI